MNFFVRRDIFPLYSKTDEKGGCVSKTDEGA